MDNKKSKKWLYISMAILGFFVLLLGFYIIYNKFFEKNNQTNKNNNVTNQNNINKNYANWMDYILDTNISSIKLDYCVDDTSNELGVPTIETIDITKNDLNRIFNEMKSATIIKNYYGGMGGPCMPSIDVTYTYDNKQYQLDLFLYRFIDPNNTKDQKILSDLENTNYMIEKHSDDIDLNVEPYMFEYLYASDIVNRIIDEYIK